MSNTLDLLIKRLKPDLSEHGAVSKFCRKTGFSRTAVDKWLKGMSAPTVDSLDQIAEALGIQPWELIRPEGALPTPQPVPPTVTELLDVIAAQEKRTGNIPPDVLEALASADKDDEAWTMVRATLTGLGWLEEAKASSKKEA